MLQAQSTGVGTDASWAEGLRARGPCAGKPGMVCASCSSNMVSLAQAATRLGRSMQAEVPGAESDTPQQA